MKRTVVAVVLAAGSGTRFGGTLPKQFCLYEGRTVVERAIDAFQQSPLVDKIAVVVAENHRERMNGIVQRNVWTKIDTILLGGTERYLSSVNAIEAYSALPDDDVILLHDAARPFVSQRVIANVVEALNDNEAAAAGIAATDTLWMTASAADDVITAIPDRRRCYQAQTPQGFRLGLLRRAYARALVDPDFSATDDCGVVLRYVPQAEVRIVQGDVANRKITFAEDMK